MLWQKVTSQQVNEILPVRWSFCRSVIIRPKTRWHNYLQFSLINLRLFSAVLYFSVRSSRSSGHLDFEMYRVNGTSRRSHKKNRGLSYKQSVLISISLLTSLIYFVTAFVDGCRLLNQRRFLGAAYELFLILKSHWFCFCAATASSLAFCDNKTGKAPNTSLEFFCKNAKQQAVGKSLAGISNAL